MWVVVCSGVAWTDEQKIPVAYRPTAEYKKQVVSGWTVYVSPQLAKDDSLLADALREFEAQLHHLKRRVPAAAVKKLQQVPIWLEYQTKRPWAEYHPNIGWLKAHGFNPDKAKCVEIGSAKKLVNGPVYRQTLVLVHELSHAYHDRVLGFDHAGIKQAYDEAKKAGIYDKVLRHDGKTARHYALSNHKEYFAEMSEAFFATNDFYPFVRAELQQHDPRIYELLEILWGERTPASGDAE
jgi:hypothetical protein